MIFIIFTGDKSQLEKIKIDVLLSGIITLEAKLKK
jgi:hypothetical protein